MRIVTKKWFITTVTHGKTMEDGTEKRVKENYCLDAITFTDCEASVIKAVRESIGGGIDVDVTAESIAPFSEVFFTDNDEDGKFFKVKVDFVTLDEKTGKENTTKVTYLVQAGSIGSAKRSFDTAMRTAMGDYVIRTISETNIIQVFDSGKR